MNAWIIIAPTKIKNREKQNVEVSNSKRMKNIEQNSDMKSFPKKRTKPTFSFHFILILYTNE